VGFTGAFTSILLIGSGVALAGALCAFALVRGRDFVASTQPEQDPAEPAHADLAAA